MKTYAFYKQLKKPTWAPPSKVFGPVWTLLYVLIAISFGYAGYSFFKDEIPFLVLLPFILNLIFNLTYTPIQFGLKSIRLAALDIMLVLGTLIWLIIAIHPFAPWISYANIPYLLWVSFATALQLAIVRLNPEY